MTDWIIHHHAVVDSTQSEAWRAVQHGASSGTVIRADHQTHGRGRQGRPWESVSGNLAATLAWKLPATHRPGDYSLITAVAMHQALASFLTHSGDLTIKWPNDLLLMGVKCAGILIESPDPSWLLIGTGVNIATAPEGRACLMPHTHTPINPVLVLETYLANFDGWADRYTSQGLAPIRTYWQSHAFGLDQPMTVRLPSEEFSGIFRGLDPDGAARVEQPDGTLRKIHSGEIFFDTKTVSLA